MCRIQNSTTNTVIIGADDLSAEQTVRLYKSRTNYPQRARSHPWASSQRDQAIAERKPTTRTPDCRWPFARSRTTSTGIDAPVSHRPELIPGILGKQSNRRRSEEHTSELQSLRHLV